MPQRLSGGLAAQGRCIHLHKLLLLDKHAKPHGYCFTKLPEVQKEKGKAGGNGEKKREIKWEKSVAIRDKIEFLTPGQLRKSAVDQWMAMLNS